MSVETMRGLVFGALMIHGLGHGGALGALLWIAFRPSDPTGGWQAARSWLLPALPAASATLVAGTFWVVSMVGFVAAALAFWGIVLPGELWATDGDRLRDRFPHRHRALLRNVATVQHRRGARGQCCGPRRPPLAPLAADRCRRQVATARDLGNSGADLGTFDARHAAPGSARWVAI